ncbi:MULTISPECIES: TadG family pilus assembly protein [unclassified Burkholderia]|uniref:TadG family pilus assembly protein n=1 Tax=unclassified Burkholderia TaxID=2613784 RepID=UPI00075D753B|nr:MULTISPECIES: TadG family pilus assembly protein [unclassified Burkholderia]AOK49394.1 hypothetical protein WT60_20900 [Burkholderia sp. MSMB617WGS]KVK74054.1 hypothetical protein WS91_19250 [Burkholderia sp. MSMB1498]
MNKPTRRPTTGDLSNRREPNRPRRPRRSPTRERGSLAVIAAIAIGVVIAALGAVDLGNLFYQRRALQSSADMAALAAAQTMDDGCAKPTATAQSAALGNGFDSTASGQSMTVVCGRWDVKDNAGPSFFAGSASGTATGADAQLNAVQVTVTRSVPYYFLGSQRTVTAISTAQATNVGTYSIGTTLAQLQGGVVNALLNGLLGTNLNLSVLSYQGLANSRIKIKDLMAAANVGTVNALLNTQTSVPQLASWMLTALSQTSVANANLQTSLGALQTIVSANIAGGQTFTIGGTANSPGIFSIGLSDPQAALDATFSPFDALFVAAEIATGQNAFSLANGLNIGGLNATLQVQIIQPPVLGIGEAGIDPVTKTWRTIARTAQVRLYLNIGLGTANLPLGTLGALVPVQVNLPLSMQIAPGQAWLQSASCTSSPSTCASAIGVQTGLANLCIGDTPANLSASLPFTCSTPATLVNVANLVTIKALASLPADVPAGSAPPLTFYGTTGGYQSTNSNGVGSVLGNALSGLGTSLQQTQITLLGVSLPLGPIQTDLNSFLGGVLPPMLSGLDAAVVPLLQLLGVQIGESTIHDMSLTCGVSQLVY